MGKKGVGGCGAVGVSMCHGVRVLLGCDAET
jgi:hypothetical protein